MASAVIDECCDPGRSRLASNLPLDDKVPAALMLFAEESDGLATNRSERGSRVYLPVSLQKGPPPS